MSIDTRTGRIVGVLFVAGSVAGALSLVVLPPVGGAADVLSAAGEPGSRTYLGAFLILMMGLAVAFIPIGAHPVLRRTNTPLALGYVVFRSGLETATYLVLTVGWLVLAALGREYVSSAAPALGRLDRVPRCERPDRDPGDGARRVAHRQGVHDARCPRGSVRWCWIERPRRVSGPRRGRCHVRLRSCRPARRPRTAGRWSRRQTASCP
jgi:hypothetical protein